MDTFKNHLHLPVTMVDHTKVMMDKLRGVSDPELKRKAIGSEFIEVGAAGAAYHTRVAVGKLGCVCQMSASARPSAANPSKTVPAGALCAPLRAREARAQARNEREGEGKTHLRTH